MKQKLNRKKLIKCFQKLNFINKMTLDKSKIT